MAQEERKGLDRRTLFGGGSILTLGAALNVAARPAFAEGEGPGTNFGDLEGLSIEEQLKAILTRWQERKKAAYEGSAIETDVPKGKIQFDAESGESKLIKELPAGMIYVIQSLNDQKVEAAGRTFDTGVFLADVDRKLVLDDVPAAYEELAFEAQGTNFKERAKDAKAVAGFLNTPESKHLVVIGLWDGETKGPGSGLIHEEVPGVKELDGQTAEAPARPAVQAAPVAPAIVERPGCPPSLEERTLRGDTTFDIDTTNGEIWMVSFWRSDSPRDDKGRPQELIAVIGPGNRLRAHRVRGKIWRYASTCGVDQVQTQATQRKFDTRAAGLNTEETTLEHLIQGLNWVRRR